ncbi:hypothetical protein WA026_018649 [Henosepilachna vigintioctopunctata]|uniref:R3H domain-containing protein 1 n=1 Tax=Henosepilachna vigintioctopunctata TaxID=420089 RepID=A0AAW1U8X9_9CUCU
MQPRGATAAMDEELEDDNGRILSKNPRNAKLKVLVRSHAMREEQSPPRAPSPNNVSPCIKLTPSPQSSPVSVSNPVVVLSPSISRGNSPYRSSICISPTSTLVPSPNTKGSPRCLSPQEDDARQVLRNNNLDRDKEVQRNEYSSHVNGRRRCDNGQQCTNCVKENVGRMNSRGKIRQQSSSQGSFESSHTNSPILSRDSSSEQYTDTTGIDLEIFIPETLNRNAKDRALMLRIEQELVNLAKDKNKTHYKFPPMSSYQRMLVHRCAAYFGMEHNIESSGKCVVVNKSKNTRIPCVGFKEHIKDELLFGEEPRRSILKRDSNSMEDYNFKSPDRHFGLDNRRSKSFEEREEEYEKRRDSSSMDDIVQWSEVVPPWSSTDSDTSTKYRLQLPDYQLRRQGKLIKVQSEETGHPMKNPDGSLYHYDPDNPPSVLVARSKSPPSPRKSPASPPKVTKASPPPSPKKRSSKCSPIRRLNTTNSSTSPSLPYSPPVSLNKSFSFPPLHSETAAHQQQYTMYNTGYPAQSAVPEAPVPLYQPSCLVYNGTYGVQLQPHFEGRIPMESSQMAEIAPNYYVNVPEGASTPLNTQIMYQQPATGYWPQPSVNYYQNGSSGQPRFPLVHAQSSGCLTSYSPNYMPSSQTAAASEMVPVYHNQPMQYIYPNPPAQHNQMVFPNHNSVVFAQNPNPYNNTMYPSQQPIPHYPQSTSTPNSGASSVSNTYRIPDSPQPNMHTLSQNMAQMNLNAVPYVNSPTQQGFHCNKPMIPFDGRHKNGSPKNIAGKMSSSKGFLMTSSQSSTGTSSPAATVIAGFCPQNPGMYRTPPPAPQTPCTFVPNMNMVFRPMGNPRVPTPGTNRSSRSPTPGSDISHFSGQRVTIPPTIYHGMPYVIQRKCKSVV